MAKAADQWSVQDTYPEPGVEQLTEPGIRERAQNRGLSKKLISSLSWQSGFTVATAIIHLLVIAILSRLITKEHFGLLGMVLVFVGFAQLFSQFGVGHAVIQKDYLTDEFIRVGFTLSLTLGLVMMGSFWLLASPVAHFYREPEIANIMRAVSLLFVFEALTIVAQSLMRRDLKFKELSLISLISYVFGHAIVSVILAVAGLGVWALVAGSLAQSILRVAMLLAVQPHPKKISLQISEAQSLLRYGGGITLGTVFSYGASQGDYMIVGRVLGAGPLGVYTRAYQLMAMPATNFAVALQAVIFPGMSQLRADLDVLRRLYFTAMAAVTFFCFPFVAIFIVLAQEIVLVILGPQWVEATVPLQVLALGTLFRTTYKIDHSLANALGHVYKRSVVDGVYFVAVVTGSLVGVSLAGLTGVAAGVLLALFLNYAIGTSMSLRLLTSSWREFIKTQLPGFAVGLIVAALSLILRSLLGNGQLSPIVVLLATGFLSAPVILGFLLLWPQLLGPYGLIAVNRILEAIPQFATSYAFVRQIVERFSLAEAKALGKLV